VKWRKKLFKVRQTSKQQPAESAVPADVAGEKPRSREVRLSPEEAVLLKKYGNDYQRLEDAALEQLNQRHYWEALECYRLLTKVLPEQPDYWFKCGFILCQQGESAVEGGSVTPAPSDNFEHALNYLDRALELDNSQFWAWYWSGVCHGKLGATNKDKGMVGEGLRRLDKALRIRPDDVTAEKSKVRLEKVLASM